MTRAQNLRSLCPSPRAALGGDRRNSTHALRSHKEKVSYHNHSPSVLYQRRASQYPLITAYCSILGR